MDTEVMDTEVNSIANGKTSGKVWIISDTHFWHRNIIQYCNRPFDSVEQMNEKMIEMWNAVVGKDDTVIHLGDFCFGGKAKIKDIFDRLNGKIDLVMGNHDHNIRLRDYYEMGFHRVYDKPILYGKFFILSHEPVDWIKDGGVYANIYGHVHDLPQYKDCTRNTFCACAERIEYKPILFDDIVSSMKACDDSDI